MFMLAAFLSCASLETPARGPPTSPVPSTTAVPAPPEPTLAAAAVECAGLGERRYGTACCEIPEGQEYRFPGQTLLTCRGPRVGAACTRKSDCDIACMCPGVQWPRGSRAQGPPAGTTGTVGVCASEIWAGAWMCQIDADGKVTNVIID